MGFQQRFVTMLMLPDMHQDADGLWWRETNDLPLMFSLKARK